MPKKGKKIAARQARLRKGHRRAHSNVSGAPTTPGASQNSPSLETELSYKQTMVEETISPSQVVDAKAQTSDQLVEPQPVKHSQISGSRGSLSRARRVRPNTDISVYVRKELLRISIISVVVISALVALTFIL